MKVRLRDARRIEGTSSTFNPVGLGEVIVYFHDDADSIPTSELEVEVAGKWMPMQEAFRDKYLITDNYVRTFRAPITEDERTVGWYD